ncbi:unnamed protein product [Effrenium voratum]|nr:unnamed protein product [Effrenium voratum]
MGPIGAPAPGLTNVVILSRIPEGATEQQDVVIAVDDDPGLLSRYQVEPNTQCLAEEKHMPLVHDALARAESGKAHTSPGGVIANSLRAGAWWLKKKTPSSVPRRIMLGRIGQDAAGERLRKELSTLGVEPMFDVARPDSAGSDHVTGTCCCFLANKARTMLTHLGASKSLDLSGKLESSSSFQRRLEPLLAGASQPCVVLTSGFYVQADPEGAAAVRSWCSKQHSGSGGTVTPIFAMTVAAEWCAKLPPVKAAAHSADFTFANEAEVMSLASVIAAESSQCAPTDYNAAMLVIAKWKERGWMIGTRGGRGVGFIKAGPEPAEPLTVPVPPVPAEEFVDDVGAGDAFMGGFMEAIWQALAGMTNATTSRPEGSRKRKLEDLDLLSSISDGHVQDAVQAGITAAAACIRCSGCQFPG